MHVIGTLREMRDFGGKARTTGLPDATIERFAAHDASLRRAIEDAAAYHKGLQAEMGDFLRMDEDAQIHHLQCGLVNFYPDDGVNPYVPAAARGPWVVTLKGAVLHDDGGYGMLGFGHNPEHIIEAMSRPQVMANVMTANVSQLRLCEALRKELGHTRGGSPYSHFLCLNSG